MAGRDEELAALCQAWGSGRRRGLIVHGAAGVGKSRLARECFDRAVRSGSAGARATASAATALVPLGATAHLLAAGTDKLIVESDDAPPATEKESKIIRILPRRAWPGGAWTGVRL
ncbi:hypothetical protein ABH926_003862 [Catenulispora sp. GP43]|uniref:ATP-binding protein n=1 Tax=Catenulispora sp. GP43 TaxID=3156263 RepID=UPI003513638F